MASANVELVRSIYATWERGDFSSAWWAHPDIEVIVADGPSPGTWRGLAGLAEAWREWTDAWADFHAEPVEIRELDATRVLVVIRRTGRGKTSGLDLQQLRMEGAGVAEIHDGRVIRFVNYFDRAHAFADLGLPPESN